MQLINDNNSRDKINEISRAKQTRDNLKAISGPAKLLVQMGRFDTVNEAIIETIYSSKEHQEFKTFNEWGKLGFKVVKGSKAFAVWAKPKQAQNHNTEKEGDEYKYFPICYLFSNAQVERRADNATTN